MRDEPRFGVPLVTVNVLPLCEVKGPFMGSPWCRPQVPCGPCLSSLAEGPTRGGSRPSGALRATPPAIRRPQSTQPESSRGELNAATLFFRIPTMLGEYLRKEATNPQTQKQIIYVDEL